jgi:Lon-like protease
VPAAPRVSRLWWFAAPVVTLLTVSIVVVATIPLPYVTLKPGRARPVEPLVEVEIPDGADLGDLGDFGDPEDPTADLLYLTVSTRIEPNGLVVLQGLLDEKIQVEPSAPFLGTQTKEETRELNIELMVDSQDKARKVALERLGIEVGETPVGAFIEDVEPSLPAGEVLVPGMTVVGVDGSPVLAATDLVEAIGARAPGDEVTLEVLRIGQVESEQVAAKLVERPGEPGVPLLGVSLADRVTYDFPLDIRFDTGQVGGPSAGLALTLALLDRLTPGDLTGGARVALTGTIELDGRVGPVGGVVHKTEAAIQEGATVMLVPLQEFDRAEERAAGRIDVRAVASLDDALEVLEAVGGDPLPPAPG